MWFERPVRTEAQLVQQKPRCAERLPSIGNWFKRTIYDYGRLTEKACQLIRHSNKVQK